MPTLVRRPVPLLTRIPIHKAKGHECPGIETGYKAQYLIRWKGRYYLGTFSRQWYGLSFNGVFDAGLQFDAPGENKSDWQAIWRIR